MQGEICVPFHALMHGKLMLVTVIPILNAREIFVLTHILMPGALYGRFIVINKA